MKKEETIYTYKELKEGEFYEFDFSSIDIIDTGVGFTEENLYRLKCLYNETKGYNNLGTGRVQYLHFFHNTDIHSVFEENGKKNETAYSPF